MSRGAFNVAELLKQLGKKDVRDLPVLESIQPTLAVGDAGALTPSLLPPLAWAGGTSSSNAAGRSGFQVHGLGRGGTWLREFRITCAGASAGMRFQVTETDPVAGSFAHVHPLYQMAPEPVVSVVTSDWSATLLSANDSPTWSQPQHTPTPIIDGIYLPYGWYFTVQVSALNQSVSAAILVQDVPAAHLSPTG